MFILNPKNVWKFVLMLVFLCFISISGKAQEFKSYSVNGHPELTRNFNRFSNMSVVFTEGYPVKIRRKQSGIVSATLKIGSVHEGADTNSKLLNIAIIDAPIVEAGDIDLTTSGTDWVIINNKIRTQYQRNYLAQGTKVKNDANSITGRKLVTSYYFNVTPTQLAQFADAYFVEIATSEGIIIMDADACQTAKPLLDWYIENLPKPQTSKPINRGGKKKKVRRN